MTLPLTGRQEQLWRYIKSRELSPSFAEMQEVLGLKSKSGVHRLIEALERRGYVRRLRNQARTIVAVEPPAAFAEIAYIRLLGRIS